MKSVTITTKFTVTTDNPISLQSAYGESMKSIIEAHLGDMVSSIETDFDYIVPEYSNLDYDVDEMESSTSIEFETTYE